MYEEHISRLNDVRELIDTLIRLVGAFRLPGAINKPPETRGGILELQLGYRPGSTIQEQS